MRIKVLASGSKGNCTFIQCGNLKFLVDIGITCLQVKNALSQINIQIEEIDAIFITHSHKDHTKGLATLLKSVKNISVCTINEVYLDLIQTFNITNYTELDEYLNMDEVNVEVIRTSHDVPSCAYIFGYKENELVYITDTGYLNRKFFPKISNKQIYIIESNHDEKMLMEGPYPYILKQRILSDKGHLSNAATGKILKKVIGENTKYIFLAHISEHNNTKELALDEVKKSLSDTLFNLENIIITDQYVSLDMIEV